MWVMWLWTPPVGDVAVDAAVGQQAEDVQRAVPLLAVVHGLNIGLILKEGAVLNGLGDPGQILEHHPARADVGVTHLGVAHLPLRQAHVHAGGRQLAAGVLGKDLVQVGGTGGGNGVAGLVAPQAKTVHDNEGSRCFTHSLPLFSAQKRGLIPD